MSDIHYFQRYSQKENVHTNNTLLLFSRICSCSSSRFNDLMSELLNDEIDIGVRISQQTKSTNSVPDGEIRQSSFRIVIEAKTTHHDTVDVNQIMRHVSDGINREERSILLIITVNPISHEKLEHIKQATGKTAGTSIYCTTYETICKEAKALFHDYEVEMNDIVNDYESYCQESNLISHSQYYMRIVPVGQSHGLNRKYNTYFQPTARGYSKHSYIGLYWQKAIRSIFKVESIYDVSYSDGVLEKTLIDGADMGDKFNEQIAGIIDESLQKLGWNIAKGHRFFCASEQHETLFIKSTRRGIQGARNYNLAWNDNYKNLIEKPSALAQQLNGQTWG